MYHRVSDPCRMRIQLMGLMGLERGGSEVTDHSGPEVQHQDVRVLRLTVQRVMAPWGDGPRVLGLKHSLSH